MSDRGRGEIEAGVEGVVLMAQMINAESKLLCLWVMEGKRPLLFANLFIIFNIILLIKSHASSILLFSCIVY